MSFEKLKELKFDSKVESKAIEQSVKNVELRMDIKRGDIYIADLSGAIASEQKGEERPVLIIQNDVGNRFAPTVIVVPLTTKCKRELPTHFKLEAGKTPVNQTSYAICEQIRTIDKSRLKGYVGKVREEDLEGLNECLLISLGIGK
ncbi:type II toxin-antitoxin system PemK/MazF family toxin [Lysinibacillus sphaericus]|uniref:type II toxin-antitoxin system PemK/MazF family toxin n=1 Tax=Lysinibacillus sphaericus TaxID=1421 RepID=UPI0027D28808|nr:type II toxin-antitoxin system PemK/MazF family toxin [Lysinibacillus sphaericus]